MKHVTVTTAFTLSDNQTKALRHDLNIKPEDEISFFVDPSAIAGIKVAVDGRVIDLTVKHQLAEIEQE